MVYHTSNEMESLASKRHLSQLKNDMRLLYYPSSVAAMKLPAAGDTMGILLAMQKGGADIIELGVPCTSPFADGPTIQNSHRVAIENGTAGVHDCLNIAKATMSKGLTVPIILMGYYEMFGKEYDFDLE